MERAAAEEPPAHGCGRGGRPRAPEVLRRQRRRELDARRSRCRIRIGGHLERWCRLKEQLGFALHSQLAQFLLDRYSDPGGARSAGSPEPGQLPAASLQRLVVLSHGHGQECGFVPDVQPRAPGSAAPLVWECLAGHSFSWGGPASPPRDPQPGQQGQDPPPAPRARRGTPDQEQEEQEEGTAGSPSGDSRAGGGHSGAGGTGECPGPQVPPEPCPVAAAGGSPQPEQKEQQEQQRGAEPQGEKEKEEEGEEEEEEEEGEEEEDDLAYSDDLRDQSYHPSPGR
ncbi:zinc finger protein 692-like [Myiozetetes cayanensis]|uniref:zinc finger protein 692-like n=1 Tax=Myiozetetes cayanensis TaxID=478635 RepID=UPI00215F015D|nr:zinc finger protein 692-like [Myiozetetes cayanensis]